VGNGDSRARLDWNRGCRTWVWMSKVNGYSWKSSIVHLYTC